MVWKARGKMIGLPVTVVGSYMEGKGELMRYLSELPAYPAPSSTRPALCGVSDR